MREVIYYTIADFIVAMKGGGLSAMNDLPEFDIFETERSESVILTIELNPTKPVPSEEMPYFTVTANGIVARLFKTADGYGMNMSIHNSLQLSLLYDSSLHVCSIRGNLHPVMLRYALWVAFNWAVVHSASIALHASAVVYHRKALLCLGESGTGKSTHSRLICQKYPEALLLNDDSPIIRVIDGKCWVYGSPWSGKTSCHKNERAELGSIVRLSQAKHNEISRYALHESIGALLPSFPPELYRCNDLQSSISHLLSEIIDQADVYALHCLPNEAAAELSIHTLSK